MISLCMSVYGQPHMLRMALERIASYDDDILEAIEVIVVDDCGDPPVDELFMGSLPQLPPLPLRVFRITKNVPWNQPMGRNLAMHHAKPSWCLMLDPDMLFDRAMIRKVLDTARKMQPHRVLRYGLRHQGAAEIDMSSPNTYLIHRDDFFAVGGYDEDFCGHKGWSDVQLLDVLKAAYPIDSRKDLFAEFINTNQCPDAAVHTLDRSTAHNRVIRKRKVAEAQRAGGWLKWVKKHKGTTLRLPWQQVFPKTSAT